MSEIYRGEQQQQVVVAGMGDGLLGSPMMSMYHVPQQSRREKLRYPSSEENPLSPLPISTRINPQHLRTHPHLAPSSSSSSSLPLQKSLNGNQHHISIPRSSPMEPFTGYAAVLDGSKFLIPTQNMLAELCDVGLGRCGGADGFDDHSEPLAELQMVVDQLRLEDMNQKYTNDESVGNDQRRIKTWLISTLNEVYNVCKQYLHQLRSIISAFESVAGLSNAAPYASLAMESMSRHFCRIKDAICDQLCYAHKAHFHLTNNEDSSKSKKEEKFQLAISNGSSCYRRTSRPPTPLQGSSANHPRSSNTNNNSNYVWRPQRGLPEKAVAVLKAWLFEHFLHPYPTDTDKHMLAKQTGLTRNQVSNWFINARVRLWKPMVEEIHSLEQRQSKKVQIPAIFKTSSEQQPLPLPSSSPSPSMVPSTSSTADLLNVKQVSNASHFFRDVQNALSSVVTVDIPQPCNFSPSPVDTSSRQQQHTSNSHVGGFGTGVSLTLGLQQNNNTTVSISEQQQRIPLNVARHFGFEDDYIPSMSLAAVGKDVVSSSQQQFFRDFIG